jgi:hypothetical protein
MADKAAIDRRATRGRIDPAHTIAGTDQRHGAPTELGGICTREMSLSIRPDLNRDPRNEPLGQSGLMAGAL